MAGVVKDLFHNDGLSLFSTWMIGWDTPSPSWTQSRCKPRQLVLPSQIFYQPPKSKTHPYASLRLQRHPFQPMPGESLYHTDESCHSSYYGQTDEPGRWAFSCRPFSFLLGDSKWGLSSFIFSDSVQRPTKSASPFISGNQGHSSVVTNPGESQSRHSPRTSSIHASPVHRYI